MGDQVDSQLDISAGQNSGNLLIQLQLFPLRRCFSIATHGGAHCGTATGDLIAGSEVSYDKYLIALTNYTTLHSLV